MGEEPEDSTFAGTLRWALQRMEAAGYHVKSNVTVEVDAGLKIMGYARSDGDSHTIVIAEWALDSEMLGGLILHELAHIYHTEMGSPSHSPGVVDAAFRRAAERDGLTEKESTALTDAFSHLQNIMVDDIVFASMSGRDLKLAQRFFADWVSEKPTGDTVVDAVLLVRNAFAIASLKRRGLTEGLDGMLSRNDSFLSFYGKEGHEEFDRVESFLEKAKPDWSASEFRRALDTYIDMILGLMKERRGLQDLR